MAVRAELVILGLAIAGLVAFQLWRLWGPAWLRVDARLPTTTRGPLKVSVVNRGGRTTKGLRARVVWTSASGEELVAFDAPLDPELDAKMEFLWTFQNPQLVVPRGETKWRTLSVEVRADNAMRKRTRLDLAPKSRPSDAPPEERPAYAAPVCVDGTARHRFEARRAFEEGIALDWDVCAICHFARPTNRTPEMTAAIEAARRARLQSEEARLDRERPARESGRTTREAPPASSDTSDSMPLDVAFWTLGLSPNASWEDVQAAHRRLAREFHPDLALPAAREGMAMRMVEINRARDRLRYLKKEE